ncbi:outer membrane beta-barrel protein [Treponema sp.]|uniref:outer membrane beta-barrel protein n=1 Tax=Treponema sp. TaxID=166 RepID=UPI00298E0A4C|nr:outer membrane beta-barrel protein [Treponema sp.]MCQ2241336.1 porin family protein [Treponema sp.]
MKKTLIAVAAAAALTTSAFAEITFGSWLRVLTAPVASDGKDTVASMGNSWGWGARVARIDVHAAAEDGKVGFEMGVWNDKNNGLSAGDDAYIWAKPVDAVKVSYGQYDNPTPLRGDFCYGSWNWLRPQAWLQDDEGLLMSGKANNGLKVEITPMDGLYVLVMAPIDTTQAKAEDVYKNLQTGFAYNIEGVGKLKAQLILKNTPKVEAAANTATGYYFDTTTGTAKANDNSKTASDATLDKTVEVAFDLTSVENLYVGVGFQMVMLDKMEDRGLQANQKMKIALAAGYQVNDELKVSASGAYFMYQKGKNDGGQDGRFQAGVGVDYNLGDGMNLSADVRYLAKAGVENNDKTDRMAFSVGVTKGISSNGYIGAAFQAQTNSGNWATNVIKANAENNDKLTWCVPVAISCWF